MTPNRVLLDLLARWKETGRVGFHYPRRKQVSLNGGRRISEDEAVVRLTEFFKTYTPDLRILTPAEQDEEENAIAELEARGLTRSDAQSVLSVKRRSV